ncbi:phage GP46 family protein [Acetobacter persici]|uniref:phage GP46 family protein n=1 Tax=Acetobacter persici TaxID=1076596 RepID=UPI001BAE2822|nr:phage GP46 family protein [Acetobacter persici]MBS1015400.1 phage GP46 family protein [Acetobacter persici]
MADYTLIYDETKQTCDIDIASINSNQKVDVETGQDLITAIQISLLSDRAAEADWTYSLDKRGWWGDADNDRPLGSKLWTLAYLPAANTQTYLGRAEGYAIEALSWLIDDGICKDVDCDASYADSDLMLNITLTKADNSTLQYAYLWSQ